MFATRLHVAEHGKRGWELTKDLKYSSDRLHRFLVVPTGFTTDLASIPWYARWLLPKHGRYSKAAVLHDWLLTQPAYTRMEADELFNDAMRSSNVVRWRRLTIYSGVFLHTLFLRMTRRI